MLSAIALGWFLSISVRMVYPALLPYLRGTYGLSLTTAGLLLTVLWIAYACGQLPGGVLADWIGERLLLVASSLLAATMLTLVIIAESALVLFAATALFGLGTALYGVSRFTILNHIYPDQLGTATGVTMAAGDLGNSVMPPAAGFIAATAAWQYGFGVAVPFFLLAGVGLWATLPSRDPAATSITDHFEFGAVLPILSRPVVLRGTVLLVLWSVIMQAVIGFHPTYLTDIKGLSIQVATVLYGFFFALGVALKPLAGRAYDRAGVRTPLLALTSAASIGLVAFPFVGGIWPLLLLTVLTSSLLGFETIVISDITRRLPNESQGTSLGAVRTIYIALGALSPVLFGAVADRGYFDEGFVGIAVLAGLIALVAFVSIDY